MVYICMWACMCCVCLCGVCMCRCAFVLWDRQGISDLHLREGITVFSFATMAVVKEAWFLLNPSLEKKTNMSQNRNKCPLLVKEHLHIPLTYLTRQNSKKTMRKSQMEHSKMIPIHFFLKSLLWILGYPLSNHTPLLTKNKNPRGPLMCMVSGRAQLLRGLLERWVYITRSVSILDL